MQDSLPPMDRSRDSQDVNEYLKECKPNEAAPNKLSWKSQCVLSEDGEALPGWSIDVSGQSNYSTASASALSASALSICSSVTVASTESKMTLSTSSVASDPTFDVSRTPTNEVDGSPPSRIATSEDDQLSEIRDRSPRRRDLETDRKARNSFRKKKRSPYSSPQRSPEKTPTKPLRRSEKRSAERRSSKKRSKREGSRRSGKDKQIDTGCCVVTGKKGTRVMREIKFPTVLIKMEDRKFCKGMVHYVVLIPVADPNVKIPGVVMSHPSHPKGRRTTHYAELLPLLTSPDGNGPCTPLLNYKQFRPWFYDGARFQLRVLAFGRPNMPWRELNPPPTVAALRKQVTEDIGKFPMNKIRAPSAQKRHHVQQATRSDKQTHASTTSQKKRKSQTSRDKLHVTVGGFTPDKKLSDYLPNLRIRGLSAAGGHRDFASWFASLPPDVSIDSNFQCDTGVLRKDTFRDLTVLDKYLGISEVV